MLPPILRADGTAAPIFRADKCCPPYSGLTELLPPIFRADRSAAPHLQGGRNCCPPSSGLTEVLPPSSGLRELLPITSGLKERRRTGELHGRLSSHESFSLKAGGSMFPPKRLCRSTNLQFVIRIPLPYLTFLVPNSFLCCTQCCC